MPQFILYIVVALFCIPTICSGQNYTFYTDKIKKNEVRQLAQDYLTQNGVKQNISNEEIAKLSIKLNKSFRLLKKSKAYKKNIWKDWKLKKKYYHLIEVNDNKVILHVEKFNAYLKRFCSYSIDLINTKVYLKKSYYITVGCPRF